jgi:hypothetical protein
MTISNRYLANITLLLMAFAMPAYAASSAASSASDSIATSVGSVSGSIQKLSGSSSRANAVAEGDYRIVEVTALVERPGMARMKLRAVDEGAADREFFLTLPQRALDQSNLATGGTVTARKRRYGADFANAETREVFFLVLDDERYRELRANAVVL